MSTMVNEICVSCSKVMGKISTYDLEFTSKSTCWECVFKACTMCNGQGYTGWVSPDGDYDFDYCYCNPLNLTLEEVK